MQGQRKISSFFLGTSGKRSCESVAGPPSKISKAASPLSPSQNENKTIQRSNSLSPEQQKAIEEKKQQALMKLASENGSHFLGKSWRSALCKEFNKDYFVKLQRFIEAERKSKTVYPVEKDVYSWSHLCDIDKIKVVILGQDPYHGPRQAHGLCFSVQPGVPAPPSLVNIYKELEKDIEGFKIPSHGYLAGWAVQGVLLLNACLTVVAHQANSHKDKGWEKFTDAVIRWFNENSHGTVFILWGAYAQKKGGFIDKKKHLVLQGPHPSPLSAHRGFFGCNHFSKANTYLKEKKRTPIDWTYLPLELPDNDSGKE